MRWKRGGIAAGAVLVLGIGAVGAYFQMVKAGVLRYNRWDRRERGDLGVGDAAPDVAVMRSDGSVIRLSTVWASRPVFLVFGSCT